MKVIAVTAPRHSLRLDPADPDGVRLLDVVDVVLDNHAPYGDAFLDLQGVDRPLVPFSGLGAVAVMWAVVARTTELLVEAGISPSVYRSVHLPGGKEDAERIDARYRETGH